MSNCGRFHAWDWIEKICGWVPVLLLIIASYSDNEKILREFDFSVSKVSSVEVSEVKK